MALSYYERRRRAIKAIDKFLDSDHPKIFIIAYIQKEFGLTEKIVNERIAVREKVAEEVEKNNTKKNKKKSKGAG